MLLLHVNCTLNFLLCPETEFEQHVTCVTKMQSSDRVVCTQGAAIGFYLGLRRYDNSACDRKVFILHSSASTAHATVVSMSLKMLEGASSAL